MKFVLIRISTTITNKTIDKKNDRDLTANTILF